MAIQARLTASVLSKPRGLQSQTFGWELRQVSGAGGGRPLHREVGSDGVLPQLAVLGRVALLRLCAALDRYLVVFPAMGDNGKRW